MKNLLFIIPGGLFIYLIGYYKGLREYTPAVMACSSVYNNTPDPKIKVIDWSEEFNGVLGETGQINSPMAFKMSGDTLKVEFDTR